MCPRMSRNLFHRRGGYSTQVRYSGLQRKVLSEILDLNVEKLELSRLFY